MQIKPRKENYKSYFLLFFEDQEGIERVRLATEPDSGGTPIVWADLSNESSRELIRKRDQIRERAIAHQETID